MSDATLGILQFVGAHGATDGLPRRASVRPGDRYLTDLLIRHFQRTFPKARVRVSNWSKASDPTLRAEVEEAALLGAKPFFVVLGAPSGWVRSLEPAVGTRVLAEQPDGRLAPEEFRWQNRKLLLRALARVLRAPWPPSDLERLDWSWTQSWADFEPLLSRGVLLGWDYGRLRREASARTRANVFGLVRDGRWADVRFLGDRYGLKWLYRHLMEFSVLVARYHALQAPQKGRRPPTDAEAERRLGVPRWQFEQVRDAARDVPMERVVAFARRIVRVDPLCQRNLAAGLDLLLLGAKL